LFCIIFVIRKKPSLKLKSILNCSHVLRRFSIAFRTYVEMMTLKYFAPNSDTISVFLSESLQSLTCSQGYEMLSK